MAPKKKNPNDLKSRMIVFRITEKESNDLHLETAKRSDLRNEKLSVSETVREILINAIGSVKTNI